MSVTVHQALSGAGPFDAITNEARAFRRLFTDWGWSGRDVAAHVDPRMGDVFADLSALDAAPGDVLLIHYSAHAPRLRELLAGDARRLLLYHNITPAHWFWDHEPMVAIQCAVGRRELPEFVKASALVAGDSEYNLDECRRAGAERTALIPILFHRERLGAPGPLREPDPEAPRVLFVGRLTPSKRQDDVIRTVAALRSNGAPGARLTLVGEPLSPRFRERLAGLAGRLLPGACDVVSGLSAEELHDRFRDADVFLCLSEHEGFCIPLLEAFHFGVPVVARPAAAVPETAGDAALLVPDRDPAVIAEAVKLAAGNAALRAELRARGEARLAQFDPARTAAALRAAVAAAARP